MPFGTMAERCAADHCASATSPRRAASTIRAYAWRTGLVARWATRSFATASVADSARP